MKVLFQAQTKFAFTKEVLEGFNNINTNVIPNFFEKSTIKPIYASSGGPRIWGMGLYNVIKYIFDMFKVNSKYSLDSIR